jgi:hypothetical protein
MTGQQVMGPVKNGGITRPNGQQYNAPSITLPKGGSAILGIGEKFASNPVTGTGPLSVPHFHQSWAIWIWTTEQSDYLQSHWFISSSSNLGKLGHRKSENHLDKDSP